MIMADPMPPPAHMRDAAEAWRRGGAARASIVTIMRAPVAAIGWPRLAPLPLTFTIVLRDPELAHGGDGHRAERLVDLEEVDVAEASSPARSSAFGIASVGAIPVSFGSMPTAAQERIRASGARPCAVA